MLLRYAWLIKATVMLGVAAATTEMAWGLRTRGGSPTLGITASVVFSTFRHAVQGTIRDNRTPKRENSRSVGCME